MNFATEYLNNSEVLRFIDSNGFHMKINRNKEIHLVDKMKELEQEMKVLEDYIQDCWIGDEIPEVYSKLVCFLNKKFEQIDELFVELDDLDARAGNQNLKEIDKILDGLEKRIEIVSTFMMKNESSMAC